MRTPGKNIIILSILLVSIAFLAGCTDWKKKYDALNVEYQNTLGLLAYERIQSKQLTGQFSHVYGERTIEELQKQIAEKHAKGPLSGGY